MGYARYTFSCIISSPTIQRPGDLHGVVSTHKPHLRQKRGIAKKLILTIRAVMIGQQIDVVAGDFNGAAWRCSNRDNISTIDEAFSDCALPAPPGPTPLWGHPDQFPTTGLTPVHSLSHRVEIVTGKCACTALFPFLAEFLVYVQTIKVAIMRHGSTRISSIGAALNPSMMSMTYEFSLKNVLRRVHTGTKKRRISEVMSDHSLSS